MNTSETSKKKIDSKVLLSTLWIVVMINMLMADILSLFIPGATDEVVKFAGDTPITQLMGNCTHPIWDTNCRNSTVTILCNRWNVRDSPRGYCTNKEAMEMKTTKRNFWLDVTIFVVLLVTTITGFLLWLAFPHNLDIVFLGFSRSVWVAAHICFGVVGLAGIGVGSRLYADARLVGCRKSCALIVL